MSKMSDATVLARAIIDASHTVAESLDGVARALQNLGNGDAGRTMGAIEALGVQVHSIAHAIQNLKPFSE